MVTFQDSGRSPHHQPESFFIPGDVQYSRAIAAAGNLSDCDAVREFWQMAICVLEEGPPELWLNLTRVVGADTKLAACLVALLRRADEQNTVVHIVASAAVREILDLCRMPPLRCFIESRKAG